MDEKKIIEELNQSTEEIKVPHSLEPENIMNTIKKRQHDKKKVISFSQASRGLGGLAAVAGIILIATVGSRWINSGGSKANSALSDAINSVAIESEEKEMGNEIKMVSSYDDIYKAIKKYEKKQQEYRRETNGIVYEEVAASNGLISKPESFDATMNTANGAAGGYSTTNVQTAGIDEGDLIKTDGEYIYYLDADGHNLSIYAAKEGETELLSQNAVEGLGRPEEILLMDQQLLICGGSFKGDDYQMVVVSYDITDPKAPKKMGEYSQNGRNVEIRKVGDIIYLVSEVYVYEKQVKKQEPLTFVPEIVGKPMDCNRIFLPTELNDLGYTVISSVKASDLSMVDHMAVLGYSGTFYMGTDNIYLYHAKHDGDTFTKVRRIDYNDGKLTMGKEGTVPGVVRDVFAVNEYNHHLRIITTSNNKGDSENNLFVLDEDMKVVGSLEGLAVGERVYSARFMGTVAYFVTYRETDPLFSVDLTDPENPKLMGALKIPGFSEYLHPYGDGKLLGIGVDDTKGGVWFRPIKLSMFDITDPYNVTEECVYTLDNTSDSPALSDYKSVMIDPAKNVFGFLVLSYENGNEGAYYKVLSYEDGSFTTKVSQTLPSGLGTQVARSVYIGDYVYVVTPTEIFAFLLR